MRVAPRGAVAAIWLPLILTVVGLGCGTPTPSPGELRGARIDPPWPKPAFQLTDTQGNSFDFKKETSGKVTLLFFGFTNCPDICPVHLANLAAVLDKLPSDIARHIAVVFVTTDPERDSPSRLRDWLDNFSASFVGLRGSLDLVNRIQREIGLAPAVRIPLDDGDYSVGHAAQIMAYTTDDRAHVMYPSGTRQEDWAHDLPLLVRGNWARVGR